jgi:acetyl-CoA acetyltransferase
LEGFCATTTLRPQAAFHDTGVQRRTAIGSYGRSLKDAPPSELGLARLCIGGGQGIALLLARE